MAQSLRTQRQPASAPCANVRALASVPYILWLSVAVSGFAACREHAEQTIKDSEGRVFALTCASDRRCQLMHTANSGTSRAEGADATRSVPKDNFKLETTGRVVGVCGPLAKGATSQPSDCRPILCESARQCPAAEGLNEGVCINQLCTEPSHALIASDAVMLCLAGTGYGPTTPLQVERLALGLNCGSPCRVPKPCRQP